MPETPRRPPVRRAPAEALADPSPPRETRTPAMPSTLRRLRRASCAVAALGALVAAPAAHAASTCTFDTVTATALVTLGGAPGERTTISRGDVSVPELITLQDGDRPLVFCPAPGFVVFAGGAPLASTTTADTIAVTGTAAAERVAIDLSRGPLAPGASPEDGV